ncbi:uncharacterized protein BT62DRAFT_1078571 [Guyanagaster necrorhizus]|uniref:Uncharacterized protein n=1 Tax=Guyanagaster necrorhizus TaxID=856835 RepID=A0A9P7VMI8_9AGAR|nr:uncharacterized protein BT62DRAFT_1078571 [Guyanagaster necrorhizus MCA 3950]KAG7443187.1 hypothetical protein BT62DRAFT_1078571 [Guyanagaster necrorhizus MCA 3950]
MVNLVDLPAELLHIIFSNIEGENVTLNNICLVGNHTLLAIARPLTFREINIAFSLPLPESHEFYSKFRSVYSKETRRDSVRFISFRCSGFPDIKMSEILVKQLPRFAGVTHASVECEYNHNDDDGTCLSSILVPIIFKMPALESFSISACDLDDNSFSFDYSRPFLKHIKFDRFDSGPLLEFAHVDGVQIIEARGHYDDSTLMQTLDGISSLSESQQRLLTHLDLRWTCLAAEPSLGESLEADDVAQWFAILPEGSLPNLEVLIAMLPLREPYVGCVLEKLSVGKLKKLCIGHPEGRLYVTPWADRPIALPLLNEFTSLEEVLLPYGDDEHDPIMKTLGAPRLAHIHFFAGTRVNHTVLVAKRCGKVVKTLRTVSWVKQVTITLERDTKGDIIGTESSVYQEPAWLEFGTAAGGWRGNE